MITRAEELLFGGNWGLFSGDKTAHHRSLHPEASVHRRERGSGCQFLAASRPKSRLLLDLEGRVVCFGDVHRCKTNALGREVRALTCVGGRFRVAVHRRRVSRRTVRIDITAFAVAQCGLSGLAPETAGTARSSIPPISRLAVSPQYRDWPAPIHPRGLSRLVRPAVAPVRTSSTQPRYLDGCERRSR